MSILAITLATSLLSGTAEATKPTVPATSEQTAAELPSPAQIRRAVHDALRREATLEGPERIAAVEDLIFLHQQIGQQPQFGQAGLPLQRLVGARLRRVADRDDHGPELVDLIQKTIAPGTWESQGGPGRIYYWRPGRALVVSQSQSTHEDLADLLQQLHAAGN